MRRLRLSLLFLLALLSLTGCGRQTCAGSRDPSCRTATPCAALTYACSGGTSAVHVLASGDAIPVGPDVLASPGDVVLENDQIRVVIDAIDHPHYVAPTGGNVLDLVSQDGLEDSLTHLFHGVGLLPADTIAYDTLFLDDGEGYAAVEVRGALAGHPDAVVATRYEVRPCEPGLRIRTEIVNEGADAQTWALVDAWYWSGRETLPFAPGVGAGFEQGGFLSPLVSSWIAQPYFAAGSHAAEVAYGEVSCNVPLYGFHAEQLSAVGPAPRVVPPRDAEVFERFVVVEPTSAIAGPVDQLLEARRQLHGEAFTTLSGLVSAPAGTTLGREARASLLIEQGTAAQARSARTPVTQVTPDASGHWSARVPAGHPYVIVAEAFGREAARAEIVATGESVDAGTLALEGAAHVVLHVTVDGASDYAQVFVTPADDATQEAVEAQLFGGFATCAPLLGASTGGSPACDRVLVHDDVEVELPPGHYAFYATAGPFASIARGEATLAVGDTTTVSLALVTMPVLPSGVLSGDFHVHGAASFDSTIPDLDRVEAFLAARVDVLATTDHDVVHDYAAARALLHADDRVRVMVGLEATGHILFDLVPGAELPQVIGHWNVWPLPIDPEGTYRGAPWDELVEPGPLMDRFVEAGWPAATGIVQLNHPWAPAQVGRDLGFPRAVGVDARVPLPRTDRTGWDGTGPGLVMRTVPGSHFGNADYQTQEVMNGTENEDLMPYRAYWFYLLNQGIVRAGTANSDSHSLVDSVLGTPRTLVWSDETVADFDEVAFDAAMRDGHMVGTNGPVIVASIDGTAPSTSPLVPASDAQLAIRVVAAPWVPVSEVRIVVNGQVARTLAAELTQPTDPLGTAPVVRFDGALALSELGLVPGTDAWIVVEAGEGLPPVADLDCDGIPDTGDGDGNGVADWRDVDRNDDDVVDARDIAGIVMVPGCDRDATVGPMPRTPRGPRDGARYAFAVVTPGAYAYSFTNPFLLDWGGDGFDAPGIGGAP
ncbi:MAG: CehA/McbA family metallohydrolase [Sandaracinus sp.]